MLIFTPTLSQPQCPPPRAVRAVFSESPFSTFNTPEDTQVGAEEFFQDPKNFTFALPPYRLTDADTSPSIYFLMHPAIYRLMRSSGSLRVSSARILDIWPQSSTRAVPVFETVHRAHPACPGTPGTLMILLANINRFVLAGFRDHSPRWDTYPPAPLRKLALPWYGRVPGRPAAARRLVPPPDHTTLLRIAAPTLRTLLSFLARGKANNTRDTDRAVHLLNEARIDPRIAIFLS
ncbi:hypothetical protein B0H14DRAFT_3539617 [Mycena olivaceomarginata]|nr:hypothetical protein B0H14DRAFT_3539617 [Mycena olivaceomarginata]